MTRDVGGAPVSYHCPVEPGLKVFGAGRDRELEWLEAWQEYAGEDLGVIGPEDAPAPEDFLEQAAWEKT
jgi:hypothetical protein